MHRKQNILVPIFCLSTGRTFLLQSAIFNICSLTRMRHGQCKNVFYYCNLCIYPVQLLLADICILVKFMTYPTVPYPWVLHSRKLWCCLSNFQQTTNALAYYADARKCCIGLAHRQPLKKLYVDSCSVALNTRRL